MEFKLIIKKLSNKLTEEEEIVFSKWYRESTSHKEFFNSVKSNFNKDLDYVDVEKAWMAIQNNLKKTKQEKFYLKYSVAAIVIGILASTYFFKDRIFETQIKQVNTEEVVNKPIEPGTDKATLTLGDGSTVVLEKGNSFQRLNISSNGEKIVYEAGNNSSKEITYNYLTIPRGGQFYIVLSDGTKVWLNSESQLKYPVAFTEGITRQVELVYGEAYFDVSPSSEHGGAKFKVLNKAQEVEVLGTEFNIKAYSDEINVYTTLVEGKVALEFNGKKQNLVPNQQSNLDLVNNTWTVEKVDVNSEISWKNGIFSFNGMPLKDIMKVISRWYDVDVVFKNKDLELLKFKGVLGKQQSIEEVLSIIKSSAIHNYEIIDKIIILE